MGLDPGAEFFKGLLVVRQGSLFACDGGTGKRHENGTPLLGVAV
jgi:hypothetical protein